MEYRPGVRRRTPPEECPNWMSQHSFGMLAAAFVVVSIADLVATLRAMEFSDGRVQEANGAAAAWMQQFGPVGMVAFKLLLMTGAVLLLWAVDSQNPKLARGVLWLAVVGMGFLTLWHLKIFTMIAGI